MEALQEVLCYVQLREAHPRDTAPLQVHSLWQLQQSKYSRYVNKTKMAGRGSSYLYVVESVAAHQL